MTNGPKGASFSVAMLKSSDNAATLRSGIKSIEMNRIVSEVVSAF
jgi:hypothetical protein